MGYNSHFENMVNKIIIEIKKDEQVIAGIRESIEPIKNLINELKQIENELRYLD